MPVSFRKCQDDSKWQFKPLWEIHWYSLQPKRRDRRSPDRTVSSGEVQGLPTGEGTGRCTFCLLLCYKLVLTRCPLAYFFLLGSRGEELSHLLLHANGDEYRAEKDAESGHCFRVHLSHYGNSLSFLFHYPSAICFSLQAITINRSCRWVVTKYEQSFP